MKKLEDANQDHWMQILIKSEQFEESSDVQEQDVKDDNQTPAEMKPLEPNLHMVDQVL